MSTISSSRGADATRSTSSDSARVHTVKRGESLARIAQQHGVGLDQLIRANPQIRDPSLIHAGQQVNLPGGRPAASPQAPAPQPAASSPSSSQPGGGAPAAPRRYQVQPGDTMTHIAKDHRVTLNQLLQANPQVRNANRINPGDTLNLPAEARDRSGGGRPAAPNGGLAPGMTRPDATAVQGTLARGASGQPVREVQRRLSDLGYRTGTVDGDFGPRTQGAVRDFQTANGLETTGAVDHATRQRLFSDDAKPASAINNTAGSGFPRLERYPPGSTAQRQLFREAARRHGVPERWADSPALHNLLRRESDGWVGIPNYTYGARKTDRSQWDNVHDELRRGRITARSSATGLGQLLLANVDRYYPNGRAGIGEPVQEAAGMMRYIKDRYGSPEEAWRRYNTLHEGY